MRHVFALAALFLALAAPHSFAEEGGGIKGRSSLAGVLVENIEVRAYAYRPGGFGPLTGDPVAKAVQTALDGTYSLPLPPGRYVVEAIKKRGANRAARPEAGDLYCLYSGSPVTVAAGQWTSVGLYLTEVPAETRSPSETSRIAGRLTFKDKPVERAYLYVYANADSVFRGPADLLQPVASGSFDVRLPPGKYYLVARKRVRGGPYGPIDTGDLFNFHAGNPVALRPGEALAVEIPLIERLSQLEGDAASQGRSVKVTDAGGKPLKGYFILAYPNPARVGPPAATAGPTDAAGTAQLALPPGATHLRARATVGGPLEEGEAYGDFDLPEPPSDAPLTIKVKKP